MRYIACQVELSARQTINTGRSLELEWHICMGCRGEVKERGAILDS